MIGAIALLVLTAVGYVLACERSAGRLIRITKPMMMPLLAAAVLAVAGLFVYRLLRPDLGSMKGPVLLYTVLAYRAFLEPFPYAGKVVAVTYVLAQSLIVTGVALGDGLALL